MGKSPKKQKHWLNFLGKTHQKRRSAKRWLPFWHKKKLIRYRDERGRFISKPKAQPLRDKYGRFKKRPKYSIAGRPLNLANGLKLGLVTVGLAGTVYFGSQLWTTRQLDVVATAPVAQTQATVSPQVGMNRSEPTRIQIPAASVDTSLITLGKTEQGTLEVPKAYDVAGWYKYSPTPGEIGPTIIAGHVDNYLGAAVFYKLRFLQPGDTIDVTRADGNVVKFKVDKVEQYSQSNFPTETVYGNIDHAGIRLITCGGTFNYLTGNYSDNTVVFGSMIEV